VAVTCVFGGSEAQDSASIKVVANGDVAQTAKSANGESISQTISR